MSIFRRKDKAMGEMVVRASGSTGEQTVFVLTSISAL
jgi:hypothetical protein